jgi:S-adenosylmethionine hydrolase
VNNTERGKHETGSEGRLPGLPVITLLTDFGTADYFVGAVKGAILSVNPNAVVVDITHEIPAQDIEAGAFMLLAAYKTFPRWTTHVAVVDPGVGSARRPIVVATDEYFFVGPDNGIFTYIYDREPVHRTFHLTAEKHFPPDPSSTFHGRDIFAPVAAELAAGVAPHEFGPAIGDEIRIRSLETPLRIIHVDRFGNCVTNITRGKFEGQKLTINGRAISAFRKFYGEAAAGEIFAIWGSAGFLEISVNGGSAAQVLGAKRGDAIYLATD